MADKRVRGAPPYETDLPWNLLVDATLEELIVYYPEHVFQWPGLAILYNHYCHRSAGTLFDYAETARIINTCRGYTDSKTITAYRNRLRQWLGFSGAEILGRNYNPKQNIHLRMVYDHIAGNFQDVAWSLNQVGAGVQNHPQGFFAARIQAAMNGEPISSVDTGLLKASPLAPQWPMIWRLLDCTKTMDDRFSEHGSIHAHNTTDPMASTNMDWALLPPAETFQAVYYRERDEHGQPDPRSQTFGWTTARLDTNGEPCKIFDILDQHVTADEVIQQYWRDLDGDVFLWLTQRYSIIQIIDALPEIMYWKTYKTGRTEASKKRIYASFRKRAENALVRRLQESRDGSGYQKGKGKHSFEANRKLYLAEKAKFDSVKLVIRAQVLTETVTAARIPPEPTQQPEVEVHATDDGTCLWAKHNGSWYRAPKLMGMPDGSSAPPEWWCEERRERFRALRREQQIPMMTKYMAQGWDAQPNASSPDVIDYINADWSLVPDFGLEDMLRTEGHRVLDTTQGLQQIQAQQTLSQGLLLSNIMVPSTPTVIDLSGMSDPATVGNTLIGSADGNGRTVVDLTSSSPELIPTMGLTTNENSLPAIAPHFELNVEDDISAFDNFPVDYDMSDLTFDGLEDLLDDAALFGESVTHISNLDDTIDATLLNK